MKLPIKQAKFDDITSVESLIRNAPGPRVDVTASVMDRIRESGSMSGHGNRGRSRSSKRYRAAWITASSAAILVIAIMGSTLISPVMAASIRQIPGADSLFRLAGDLGLKIADDKGLAHTPNVSETHDGVTLRVQSAIFDGTRVAFGLERNNTTGTGDLDDGLQNIEIALDGKELKAFDSPHAPGLFMKPGIDRYSKIIGFSDQHNQGGEPFPGQFVLNLKVRLHGIEQPYTLSLPVQKTKDIRTWTPEASKSMQDFQFTVEKIESTPITTNITTRVEMLEGSKEKQSLVHIDYDVVDEEGNKLNGIGGSGGPTVANTHELLMDNQFEPLANSSKSITIKPYYFQFKNGKSGEFLLDDNGYPAVQYIPELEMTIPLE